ncbi:MAG: helix-turn-helix domain-containing protein [Streptosporangiaceae bacterium]
MARRRLGDAFLPHGPKHDLVRLLLELRARSGMTQQQIAKQAGVGEAHLSLVLRGWDDASPDYVDKITQAMRADEATQRRAKRLAERARNEAKEAKHRERGADPLQSAVTAIVRAWHAIEPVAAARAQTADSAVRQALETAVARAFRRYAADDARLDIAGPLLAVPCLLANPDVAAELAKVLARNDTPDPARIAPRWRDALTDPGHLRDLVAEATALLEFFRTEATSAELWPWLRGERTTGGRSLAESRATACWELTEVAALAGHLTVGPLPPALRMRLRDQTSLIAGHVSDFTGRDGILGTIHDVIKDCDSAYCHVLAHPGVGKTALMAKLIAGGDYVHHFNVRTLGMVTADQFLGNVCARLTGKYQVTLTPPNDAFSNGEYLAALLSEIARRATEKVVIVVDALDERRTDDELPGVNPLFLPQYLPRGVVVVLASRPEQETKPIGEWQPVKLRAECEQVVIPIDHFGDDNMRDIRAHVDKWSRRDGITEYRNHQGYDTKRFVEVLAEHSEGNFMYLHHVLPAIERGELKDRELTNMPLGLVQYYADHLELMREENLELWYSYRLPVIRAFVEMDYGPLTIAEISAASRIGDEAIVRDTLKRWSAFVVARRMPGEDGKPELVYRIYHAKFAEFLDAST